MIGALQRAWANFRGFDLTGSTVPPMDGPLLANNKLDAAPVLMELQDVDNLTTFGDAVIWSVADELHTLSFDGGRDRLAVRQTRPVPGTVTSLAALGDRLAIAVEGQGIAIEGPDGQRREISADGIDNSCITAMAFADPGSLVVAVGSRRHPAREWKRDLMTRTAAGSVWRIDLGTGRATSIAQGLAFPSGVAAEGNRVLVAEAWRHRVLEFRKDETEPNVVLGALPAYPGRIVPAGEGGFWLCMFAPRNPLVEFVLKEETYRRKMVETIESDYWIAPSLLTGRSFLEPIQGGARKKLNMLKPWSPAWSAGLVLRCDGAMEVLRSYHSRADGEVHGVTSICETGGRLLVGARGSGKIVAIGELGERSVS